MDELVYAGDASHHSRFWMPPPVVSDLLNFLNAALDSASTSGPFYFYRRAWSSWHYGDDGSVRNQIVDRMVGAAGVPPDFFGALRLSQSEWREILTIISAHYVFAWSVNEDLFIIPEDASCIPMVSHHGELRGTFPSENNLTKFVSAMSAKGFDLPEEVPDPTFKIPPWMRGAALPNQPIQRPDSSSDFAIRPSIPADAEAVWRCLDSVARERRHIAMVEPPTLGEVHSFLGTLADRGVIQFVALAGSKVVGWCDVTRKPIEGFRHSGVLGMGLLQAYRRRGLGSALLRAVLAEAQLQGLNRIELEVYTSNQPAIALYQRFGFVREGIKRSARILDGQVEDILCMALLLPPLRR